jgi:hypothetical protein
MNYFSQIHKRAAYHITKEEKYGTQPVQIIMIIEKDEPRTN